MENVCVRVRCYYPFCDRNRRVSITGCKMIWIYLLSDAHFTDLLHGKLREIENSTISSGQTLSELYVDVFWDRQVEELSVNLDFYTKEGAQKSFLKVFTIVFNDIELQSDTIKLGQDLKSFLLKEFHRVDKKSVSLFWLIFGLISIIVISLTSYGISSSNLGCFVLASFVSAFSLMFKLSLFEYCIRLYLPKETEYKSSFDIKKGAKV